MKDASFYINTLQLHPHPEGGYFKESYRSAETISKPGLPGRFKAARSFSTAIYYLLCKGDFSAFHRIKSDECWHFYAGETLLIHVIGNNGDYKRVELGANIERGETLQFVVPAMAWFAAELAEGTNYSLVGCTVAPGFDFADFEMANKKELLSAFPLHHDIILRLCPD